MIDPTLTTLLTVPAIVALVNFGKRMGLPSKGAIALALFLGVFLSVAEWAWSGQGWYGAATSGLLLGLSAAGLYDLIPGESVTVKAKRAELPPDEEGLG